MAAGAPVLRAEAFAERLGDPRRDEVVDGTADGDDFLDEARRRVRPPFARHHEDALDFGRERTVGQRHRVFGFEVGNGTETAKDDVQPASAREIDGEPLENVHFDVGKIGRFGTDHRHPLFGGEQRVLRGVVPDRDDQSVEERRRAAHQIEVAVGHRIETAGIDRVVLHG